MLLKSESIAKNKITAIGALAFPVLSWGISFSSIKLGRWLFQY